MSEEDYQMRGGQRSPTDFTPEQIAANREAFSRLVDARAAIPSPPKAKASVMPKCADMEDELLTKEIADKGLDVRKRWFRCRTTHGQHPCCKRSGR